MFYVLMTCWVWVVSHVSTEVWKGGMKCCFYSRETGNCNERYLFHRVCPGGRADGGGSYWLRRGNQRFVLLSKAFILDLSGSIFKGRESSEVKSFMQDESEVKGLIAKSGEFGGADSQVSPDFRAAYHQ